MAQNPPTERPGDTSPDALDALLQQASWPAADEVTAARLQHQWDRLVRQRRRRRQLLATAAVVAFLLGGAALYRWSRPPSNTPVEIAAHVEPAPASGRHDPEPMPTSASIYEKTVLAALDRRLQRRSQVTTTTETDTDPDAASTVVKAIKQLAADPQTDVEQLTTAWPRNPRAVERQLADFIRRSEGAEQLAAVRLLSQVATRRSLPLLHELRRWPPARAAATEAIARLDRPLTVVQLARQETAPDLQRKLMAALLQRDREDAVRLYLNLVEDPTVSAVALDAASTVSDAPVARLVALLQAPRTSQRMAAVRVLGRLPDAGVSTVLVNLVLRDFVRREALIALAARTDPVAVEFLRRARQDVMLAATVHAAQRRAELLTN